MARNALSGILNINKPAGITSHDVIRQVRQLVNIRKVGHTGTLDPIATGVLVVCLGQATRLIEYLMGGDKTYRAAIRLGQATDTYDADGRITATGDPSGITAAALRRALASFVGTIRQTPPPFSALKQGGVPLYKLARRGQAVQPKPRTVRVMTADLLQFDPPDAVLQITCQSGTYIRAIAHDLGQALGVGAHITGLTRLANGPWRIEDAISLPALRQAVAGDALNTVLRPKETGLTHLPRLLLSPEQEMRVRQGRFIAAGDAPPAPVIAAYNHAEHLVALLTPRESAWLKPKKVFMPEDSSD